MSIHIRYEKNTVWFGVVGNVFRILTPLGLRLNAAQEELGPDQSINSSHSKRLSLESLQMMSAVGNGCKPKGFQVVLVTMLNLVYLCIRRKKQETLYVANYSDEKGCGIYSNADASFARGVA